MKPDPVAIATVRGLLAGLGVEDIAVKGGFKSDDVRFQVRRLRANDALEPLMRQARNEWRQA